MERLTSILVVANRTTADRSLLERAVALARSVGVQIYLFSCDADLARRLRHAYPIEEAEKAWNICLAEHSTYLRRLQAAVCAPDVQINVDAACHIKPCPILLRGRTMMRSSSAHGLTVRGLPVYAGC
jgi:hypothetical protein